MPQHPHEHDEPGVDESPLDAGLSAAFGPVVLSVTDARVGLSALAEIEGRIGSETLITKPSSCRARTIAWNTTSRSAW